jgi:hypothetical protein
MKNYYRLFLVAIAALCLSVGVNAQKSISIQKLPKDQSITIDGIEDETIWENCEEHNGLNYVTEKTPTNVFDHYLYYFKSVWNDTAIFFLFKIDDSKFHPEDEWYSDQVEIYFRFGGKEIHKKDIGDYRDSGVYQVPFRATEDGRASGSYSYDDSVYYCQTVYKDFIYTLEGYVTWDRFVEWVSEGDSTKPVEPRYNYSFDFDINCQDNDSDPNVPDDLKRGYWSSHGHLYDAGVGWWDTTVPGGPGRMTLLGISSIEEFKIDQFEIHPNPVQDVLTIQGDDVDVDEAVIYSITGKAVLRSSLVNKNTINVSGLYNGVYLLELYNEGEYLGTKKIIVAKEE